jgi:hypothetical protein
MINPGMYSLPGCLKNFPEDVAAHFQKLKYKSIIDDHLEPVAEESCQQD